MADALKTGGSAFPAHLYDDSGRAINAGSTGLTIRQYAAIHLKVPNSGTDWLDDMIREGSRGEMAGRAMQGLLQNPSWDKHSYSELAAGAHGYADAMLKAGEKGDG